MRCGIVVLFLTAFGVGLCGEKVRLIVAPFDGSTEKAKTAGAALAETVILTLRENAKGAIIYDHERLLWALNRALLRYAALDEAGKATRLANTLGANYVLTGRVASKNGKIKVICHLHRCAKETKTVVTLTTEGDFEEVAKYVVSKVAENLKLDLSSKEPILPVRKEHILTYGKVLVCKRDPDRYSEAAEAVSALLKAGEKGAAVRFHSGWLLLQRALMADREGDDEKASRLVDVAEKVFVAATRAGGARTYVARAFNSLGLLAMDERHWADAEQRFGQAIATDGKIADAHRNIAAVYRKLRRYKKAVEHLKKAAEIAPNDAAIYNDLGSTLIDAACELLEHKKKDEAKQELDKACKAYRKALALDAEMVEAAGGLALALDLLEKKKEALKYYRLYEKLGGDDGDLLDRLDALEQELKNKERR